MWGLLDRQCCSQHCQHPGDYHTIEFDSDFDPSVPANLRPDGSVGQSTVSKVVTSQHRTYGVPEAEDTDNINNVPGKLLGQDDKVDMSDIWSKAHEMRDVSKKLRPEHYEVGGYMHNPASQQAAAAAKQAPERLAPQSGQETPIMTFSDNVPTNKEAYTLQSAAIQGAFEKVEPTAPQSRAPIESHHSLQNIQEELDRTRQLLGLPPKQMVRPAPETTPTATIPEDSVMQEGDGASAASSFLIKENSAAIPAGSPEAVLSALAAPGGDAPLPTFGTATAEGQVVPVERALSKEEQKQKIKDEVAALREKVRKAKTERAALRGDAPSREVSRDESAMSSTRPTPTESPVLAEKLPKERSDLPPLGAEGGSTDV